AVLDHRGYLKYANDYEMEVRLEHSDANSDLSGKTLIVPLYTVMDVEDASADNPLFPDSFIKEGQQVAMEGIMFEGQLYPQRIGRSTSNLREEGRLENRQLVAKEYEVVPRFASPTEYH